jgi:MFS family permease
MFVTKWGFPGDAADSGGFLMQIFSSFFHMFSTAGGITSIVIFASMVCAPFAGGLLDRIGRRASAMLIGSLLLIPAHLAMGLTTWSPIPSMIVLGAAFVLVPAALWPSVPMVVEPSRVGTAFGLLTAIQNVGLMASQGGYHRSDLRLRRHPDHVRRPRRRRPGLRLPAPARRPAARRAFRGVRRRRLSPGS